MKHETKRTEALVGLFMLFGLVLLGGLILRFSSIRENFRERDIYSVIFDDASGLSPSAPVRLGGTRIGRVAKAPTLTPDGKVLVDIVVYRDERSRIPKGSRITIAKEGLLGDSYIAITRPGEAREGYFEPGARISGAMTTGLDSLQDSAGRISLEVQELVKELRSSVKNFDAAVTRLNEQVLTAENTESVKKSITSLNNALAKLDGQVLSDENTANVKQALADLRSVSETIAKQSERVEPIVTKADAAMTKFGQAADSIKESGAAFKKAAEKAGKTFVQASDGDGLLAALLNDPKLRDDFAALVANLRSRGVLFYKDKPAGTDAPAPDAARRAPFQPPRPPGR